MCKRCVVEVGWVPDVELDIERYLVDWWPGNGTALDPADWYATKERLAGFGEALVMVGACQAGHDVLMLSDLAADRDIASVGIGDMSYAGVCSRSSGASFYSLYTKPLRAVRF